MTSVAIVLVSISAITTVFRDFFTKSSSDKYVFLWWYQVIGQIIWVIPLIIYCFIFKKFDLLISPKLIFPAISGILYAIYFIFLSKAYEKGDFSFVYPLLGINPITVSIFSYWFLNEKLSFLGIIGIIIVVFGAYIINMKKLSLSEFLKSFKALKNNEIFLLMLGILFLTTSFAVADKIGVNQISDPFIFWFLSNTFLVLFYTPMLIFFEKKEKSHFKKELRYNKKAIFFNATIGLSSYLLVIITLLISPLSYVLAFRNIGSIFAVLLGIFVFKEPLGKIRLVAVSVIFLGIVLISMAS